MSAVDNARAALSAYKRWANSIHGGTTANEDAMGKALSDLIAEYERLAEGSE